MDDIEMAIQQALQRIEVEEQVHILYACESGSRAWGFASQDSDYDVRFLYVRPKDAYLRIDLPRDVIERPIVDDLDINGWDIFKALRLLRRSNPPLLEWLFSPLVYQENSTSIVQIRDIARKFYSPVALYYHYSRMATGNYRQYLQDKSEVILKKYLYTLRPLIALLFLQQRRQLPPTNFLDTLTQVEISSEIRSRIHDLIARKQAGNELGKDAPDILLNRFIEEQMQIWSHQPFEVRQHPGISQELDMVLHSIFQKQEV